MPNPWTEAEALELVDLLELMYGETLADFIRQRWPREPPPRHLLPLCALFDRALRGEGVRACVSMPRRHGKSRTVARGIARHLLRTPADRCGYASYNTELALSVSAEIRAYAREIGVELRDDTQKKSEWRTPQGGGLYAVGIEGGLTGKGITGVMVIDDPIKDHREAESRAAREDVWRWFTSVANTGMEPGSSLLVVHTRWHPDDLIGRVSARGGFEVVNFPAIAEEGDPLGRVVGEALWPEQYPLARLEEIRRDDEWGFAALYQGRPRPRGHKVFGDAHHYEELPEGCRYVIGCDPAATASTRADFSVAVVLAVRGSGSDAVGYVVDVVRRQCEVPDFVADLRALSDRYGFARVVVEAVGGFKAVPQMLRRLDDRLEVQEAKMTGDKFVRAQGAAAAWNSGRLLVPQRAPWLADFVSEVGDFTGVGDARDDSVDALAHAWNAAEGEPVECAPDIEDLTRENWVTSHFGGGKLSF